MTLTQQKKMLISVCRPGLHRPERNGDSCPGKRHCADRGSLVGDGGILSVLCPAWSVATTRVRALSTWSLPGANAD